MHAFGSASEPPGIGRAQAVEQQFDNDSGDYLSKHLTPENISEQRRILKFIERKGDVETLLDIGCGPGTMTKQLSDLGQQVWGLDISADMIEHARACWREKETAGEVVFEVGNAENLRFDTGYFDAVVAVGVLRYLESLEKGLEEIYRVLKPNGIMVVTFYYRFSLHWFVMCLFYRPLLPFISIVKGRSLRDCMLKYRAEPLPFFLQHLQKDFQ